MRSALNVPNMFGFSPNTWNPDRKCVMLLLCCEATNKMRPSMFMLQADHGSAGLGLSVAQLLTQKGAHVLGWQMVIGSRHGQRG